MAASAQRVALALLSASRGRALSAPVLVGAAGILGLSGNAMRVALSRLSARGEVTAEGRGRYTLAPARLAAVAHVRSWRTGFARRVEWSGRWLGVLTADLGRRNATLAARRERSLELTGFRLFAHGLWVRPDNLEGGRETVAAHLARLGLDDDAQLLEVGLDATQARKVERAWNVAADARQAHALRGRVEKLLTASSARPVRAFAAQSFWLGDEVLRFLARDPLLPARLADPAPRQQLAGAMGQLDERGYRVWHDLLEELER